jgi:ribosomal-protein-alanine N-acetyltransferase
MDGGITTLRQMGDMDEKDDLNEIIEVPEFETERLILRNMTRDDVDFIREHFSQSEINRYSSSDNIATENEANEYYEKYFAPTHSTRFRVGMQLKETGELMGTIGIHKWSKKDCCAELGYDLSQKYWGQGLMSEALEPIIRFGFEKMKLNRIEATTNAENKRSITLLEKNGFIREGVMRKKYYYKGKFQDDVMYSLLKDEWGK